MLKRNFTSEQFDACIIIAGVTALCDAENQTAVNFKSSLDNWNWMRINSTKYGH